MRTFRKASAEDADDILALYKSVAAKGRADGTSDWDDEYPNGEILDEDLAGGSLFVLAENGEIIAAVSILEEELEELRNLPWTNARACFLARLCVSPLYQGKGLGEWMMRRIGDYARDRGFAATRHIAAVVNIAANRLYARMGYRNLGPIYAFGTDFLAYEMLL